MMLASTMRNTMQWFESTPVGRIINRFSKDIEAVESSIPSSYRMVFYLINLFFSNLKSTNKK
jgi:ABC-type multidrug transport system fused ATPase/permease subunit